MEPTVLSSHNSVNYSRVPSEDKFLFELLIFTILPQSCLIGSLAEELSL